MESPTTRPDLEPDDPGGLRAAADTSTEAPAPKRRRRGGAKKKKVAGTRKAPSETTKQPSVKQEMLINVAQPEECRIGILEDGVLEELYVERSSQDNYVGNIYKGRIVNLEPSIQAAFVDFGVGRNGFLHISDVEPQYFRQGGFDPDKPISSDGTQQQASSQSANSEFDDIDDVDDVDESGPRRPRNSSDRRRPGVRPRIKPPIQEIFQRGDEVVVQVIKEGIGTKGPTLSTYISIPGRYVVLMPALGRIGVSRKIEERRRPPPVARHPPRAQSSQGPGVHCPHGRYRPHQEGNLARPGVPVAAMEDDCPPHQERRSARRTSTKRAT